MSLEEVVAQFTDAKRTAINTVGKNQIIVRRFTETEFSLVVETPDPAFDINYSFSHHPNLREVKNRLIGWSFSSEIDQNGWHLSPERD